MCPVFKYVYIDILVFRTPFTASSRLGITSTSELRIPVKWSNKSFRTPDKKLNLYILLDFNVSRF